MIFIWFDTGKHKHNMGLGVTLFPQYFIIDDGKSILYLINQSVIYIDLPSSSVHSSLNI